MGGGKRRRSRTGERVDRWGGRSFFLFLLPVFVSRRIMFFLGQRTARRENIAKLCLNELIGRLGSLHSSVLRCRVHRVEAFAVPLTQTTTTPCGYSSACALGRSRDSVAQAKRTAASHILRTHERPTHLDVVGRRLLLHVVCRGQLSRPSSTLLRQGEGGEGKEGKGALGFDQSLKRKPHVRHDGLEPIHPLGRNSSSCCGCGKHAGWSSIKISKNGGRCC